MSKDAFESRSEFKSSGDFVSKELKECVDA